MYDISKNTHHIVFKKSNTTIYRKIKQKLDNYI